MQKILLVVLFAIMPFLVNANLITNGDFSEGMKGFGLSDDYPQNLDARIGKDIVIGDYLAYKSKKNNWGGLNLSEVYLGPTGTYKLSFKAKASTGTCALRLARYAPPCNTRITMVKYRVI